MHAKINLMRLGFAIKRKRCIRKKKNLVLGIDFLISMKDI